MVWGRIRVLFITAAMWAVYRMIPCRITKMARILAQLSLLARWYPDTYEINRMFPNLDHVFAQWEQSLFGFQPALVFAKNMPRVIVSELMDLGYVMYYPMMVIVAYYYFFCRYREFERATFVIYASFIIYYVIFIFVPVAGPTFYYHAVGLSDIAKGVFPPMHDYFNYCTDCLPTPKLYRRHILSSRRRRQGSRRTPHSSLPKLACQHQHRMHAVGMALGQPQAHLHSPAFLHLPVPGHCIHTGSLPHRCLSRTGDRSSSILRADGCIAQHDRAQHLNRQTESEIIYTLLYIYCKWGS